VLLELWRGRRQRWWRGGGTSWWLVVVGDCRVRRKIAGEEAFKYIYICLLIWCSAAVPGLIYRGYTKILKRYHV